MAVDPLALLALAPSRPFIVRFQPASLFRRRNERLPGEPQQASSGDDARRGEIDIRSRKKKAKKQGPKNKKTRQKNESGDGGQREPRNVKM